jgi:hypothetical protein
LVGGVGDANLIATTPWGREGKLVGEVGGVLQVTQLPNSFLLAWQKESLSLRDLSKHGLLLPVKELIDSL